MYSIVRASSSIDRPSRVLRSTSPEPKSKMSPSRPEAISFPGSTLPGSHDAGGLVAPVAVAEQTLVQLAGLLAGQLTVEVDRLGALVVGEVLAAVREQLPLERV